MTNRVVVVVGVVVAVLLVAVIIVVVVLINTLNAQADQARYEACMSAQGFGLGQDPGVTDDDELDSYIDDIVAAAEFCSR